MAKLKLIFPVLCLLILSNAASAQTVGLSLDKLKGTTVGTPPQYKRLFLTKKPMQTFGNQQFIENKPAKVPAIFSVEALPFFCKIEYKMGLNKKLPVKFRLGDVQYVDEMEGKR
jgi:hypothetical protein